MNGSGWSDCEGYQLNQGVILLNKQTNREPYLRVFVAFKALNLGRQSQVEESHGGIGLLDVRQPDVV